MRIKTIDTDEQRTAMLYADRAAREIRTVFPDAVTVELAAETADGVGLYEVVNIWAAPDDDTPESDLAVWLWCIADHPNQDRLDADTRARWQDLLQQAGQVDPNVFNPGELANGVWQLDLDAVLAAGR